jgi:hypothetical protein
MSKLWKVALGAGLCCALAAVTPFSVKGQDKGKEPDWKHGMELRVRKAGEPDFTKDTQKYGVEAFKDETTNSLVYITQTVHIALAPAGTGGESMKAPEWKHAMEVRVRKAGDVKWDNAKKFGIEVFRDENNGNLVYICDTGSVSVVPGGASAPPEKSKAPEWKHGMELSVRKAGEKDFNKETKKVGIEVFSDENTGNLVYVSETGSIAVVTGVKTQGDKAPDWKHGMELAARKANEDKFTPTTQRYGVEVFRDENNGNLIYIADTGSITVVPNVKVMGGEKVKPPEWKAAMNLAVRKAGEEKFTKDTKKYGVEVFLDPNVNVHVAISESGSLAAVAGK